MVNLVINNYCNLKCPYCFADEDVICESNESMSVEKVEEVLDYIRRSNPPARLGIVGGEPTLHPDFVPILLRIHDYHEETGTPIIVYSNGIKLKDYLAMVPEGTSFLINVNAPDDIGEENFKKVLETIEEANNRKMLGNSNPFNIDVTLGCNLYPEREDYSYIWDIVDKYHLRRLRMSVVSPFVNNQKYRNNKDAYYEMMKDRYMKFCLDAYTREVGLIADCNQIPRCYFTDKENSILDYFTMNKRGYTYCDPVVDFHNDNTVSNCHGWNSKPIDMYKFENIYEIYKYMQVKNGPFIVAKNLDNDRCRDCEYAKLGKCCGGCPAFVSFDD